jgi:formate dehydrogenase (NADP+) alpha subunit
MITLTINGREIEVEEGTTVLDAALAKGIDIPRLCHHPELRPSGGCRLCLVEVDGQPGTPPSCGLEAGQGMVVQTESEELTNLRRDIIDLFISDHPLICSSCDKNGACDLQKYAYQYGFHETSYDFELSRELYQDDNPFFIRDHKFCILCSKCVRVCDEVVGANAIELVGRGFETRMDTPFSGPMIDSDCVFCGSCVQVCPTAALVPKARVGQGREWELQRQRTICGYCGVGCGIEYALKNGVSRSAEPPKILYAQGFEEAPANGEFLCVKGRFGWDFATSPDRLTRPLLRRDIAHKLGLTTEPWTMPEQTILKGKNGRDNFIEIDWDKAIEITVNQLMATLEAHGPDAVAGLASARCTNEDNYLFQKLLRATVGTNNVDHCARLCHASTVAGLGKAFGSGAMTNSIREIRHTDCLFITGSNTAESHPVIGYEVVRAVKEGASLVILDPRRIPLVDHATLHLQAKPGTDGHVFMAMMHVILREGWANEQFITSRTEGFETFAPSVAEMTPEAAALISGVPAAKIEEAARLYALGQRQFGESRFSGERGHSSILYSMGITQRSNGTDLVLTLANLAMLTGQIGKPSTGVNPLRGQSNVQGACDVGCLPNVLPGYQPVADGAKRQTLAEKWGLPDLSDVPGLTVVELMHAAEAGKVRAMYIMGENPMLSDPNITHVEEALRLLDFLVVQDIFISETAELAHLILPAASSMEKDGTFTNTERRVQLIQPVLPAPGEARSDWQIVAEIGQQISQRWRPERNQAVNWQFDSSAAVMEELARVTPIYGGMDYRRLTGDGLIWPCPDRQHPGTPILHTQQFSRGLGLFHAVQAQTQAEETDEEFPLILTTGRILYHYHTGTMTRRSEPLDWREPRGYAEINEADAISANIRDGGWVVIKSRRGQVRVQARVGERVTTGTVFLAFHWKEAPANMLTHDFALDPVAKIPEFKVCAVSIESSGRGRQ